MREKPKALLVVTMGRTGSSSVMGALELMGYYVGEPARLIPPGPGNPKGFFELFTHQNFLLQVFKGHYSDLSLPPEFRWLEGRVNKSVQQYFQIMQREVAHRPPFAVKTPWYLPLSYWNAAREHFDYRVVVLKRDRTAQAKSMLRMWKNHPDPNLREASVETILKWAEAWYSFGDQLLVRYSIPYMTVSFEDIMENPISTLQEVAEFADYSVKDWNPVREWFDPKLVGRLSYDESSP